MLQEEFKALFIIKTAPKKRSHYREIHATRGRVTGGPPVLDLAKIRKYGQNDSLLLPENQLDEIKVRDLICT